MRRASRVIALFLALGLLAGAGVLVVADRNAARGRIAARAAQLVAQRAGELTSALQVVVERVALYSYSSDGIIVYADEGRAPPDVVGEAARAALDDLRRVQGAEVGYAVISDGADRVLLQSGSDGGVGGPRAQGTLPTGLTGFRDVSSSSTSTVSVGMASGNAAGSLLTFSATIRTAPGRRGRLLSFTIPVRELIGADDDRARTQTLLGGGEVDAAMSPASRGAGAVSVTEGSRLAELIANGNRQAAEIELDGHIWAYESLPSTLGSGGYPWSFIASRTTARTPTLLDEAVPVPLLMGLGSVTLAIIGLLGLRRARRELEGAAMTDQMTGIPNRAALLRDLGQSMRRSDRLRLALFDLNGFKQYNDTFGHNAGDALLQRLARALSIAVAPGRAFRLGGDEFCVISPSELADEIESRAALALTEQGLGFAVDAAWGSVLCPDECSSVPEALAIADERMYRQKRGRQGGALTQTKAALVRLMAERDQELGDHHRRVADLATRTAREMNLSVDEVACIKDAAELHDIGLLAIPDSIREKPGPLDHAEFDFIGRHAAIGARILDAADALHGAAAIVRATHERLDAQAYPTSASADQITLSAGIISACDAYDTMTHSLAYRPAITPESARAELRACAGTQFDPSVVAALEAALDRPQPTRGHAPGTGVPALYDPRDAAREPRAVADGIDRVGNVAPDLNHAQAVKGVGLSSAVRDSRRARRRRSP
ncbi:MAG: diguanylate cyclase [Solirubrobacteraceae bacterium]